MAAMCAEQFIETCQLLRFNLDSIVDEQIGSESDRGELRSSTERVCNLVRSELLEPILQEKPHLRFLDSQPCKPAADDPRNDERAPSFKDRPPMELARHLEFHDKGNAIVARQILFGIQRLVNRLCYHADQSKDFTELERRLIKARMGLTLGGVSDTLDDLFIAHPELAIGGYGCFDWDRWRQIRDEAEVADFDAGDEDLD